MQLLHIEPARMAVVAGANISILHCNRDGPMSSLMNVERHEMAYVSNLAVSKSASHTVRGWFATLSQRFADNRLFTRTMRELDSLSDRELADLGLSRSSLRDVAREAVYGA